MKQLLSLILLIYICSNVYAETEKTYEVQHILEQYHNLVENSEHNTPILKI